MNESILFYAFRYALGRKTYAVGIVAEELEKHADTLSPSTRETIVQEIDEAELSGSLGMPMDADVWRRVREKLTT